MSPNPNNSDLRTLAHNHWPATQRTRAIFNDVFLRTLRDIGFHGDVRFLLAVSSAIGAKEPMAEAVERSHLAVAARLLAGGSDESRVEAVSRKLTLFERRQEECGFLLVEIQRSGWPTRGRVKTRYRDFISPAVAEAMRGVILDGSFASDPRAAIERAAAAAAAALPRITARPPSAKPEPTPSELAERIEKRIVADLGALLDLAERDAAAGGVAASNIFAAVEKTRSKLARRLADFQRRQAARVEDHTGPGGGEGSCVPYLPPESTTDLDADEWSFEAMPEANWEAEIVPEPEAETGRGLGGRSVVNLTTDGLLSPLELTPVASDNAKVPKSGVGVEMGQNGGVDAALETALRLADEGRRILPVFGLNAGGRCECQAGADCARPAKHPRLTGWQGEATTAPAKIQDWRRRWPRCNFGVATGAASDLLILDFDGAAGVALLEGWRAAGLIGAAREVETPSGGKHIWVGAVAGWRNSTKRFGALDLRTDGGFALLPGSRTPRGVYRWLDDRPPGPISVALRELIEVELNPPTPPQPRPSGAVPPPARCVPRAWPNYAREIDCAPRRPDGSADRSAADFRWCLIALARGWPSFEVEAELERLRNAVDGKCARHRGYARLTVERAARLVGAG